MCPKLVGKNIGMSKDWERRTDRCHTRQTNLNGQSQTYPDKDSQASSPDTDRQIGQLKTRYELLTIESKHHFSSC